MSRYDRHTEVGAGDDEPQRFRDLREDHAIMRAEPKASNAEAIQSVRENLPLVLKLTGQTVRDVRELLAKALEFLCEPRAQHAAERDDHRDVVVIPEERMSEDALAIGIVQFRPEGRTEAAEQPRPAVRMPHQMGAERQIVVRDVAVEDIEKAQPRVAHRVIGEFEGLASHMRHGQQGPIL